MIADVASMLAVDRAPALHPHFFQGVLGEPEPGGGFDGVQEWRLGLFLCLIGHVQRSLFRVSPKCERMGKRRQIGVRMAVAKTRIGIFATPIRPSSLNGAKEANG